MMKMGIGAGAALAMLAGAASAAPVDVLGTLGGTGSIAEDINDLGQVVGYSTRAGDMIVEATLWDADGATGLGFADGASFSYARAINNQGQIVGYSETGDEPDGFGNAKTATFWGPGGVVDIGSQMGLNFSLANDINDSGYVALQGSKPGGTTGYVWNPQTGGVMAGADPIYDFGGNHAINNHNNMVGFAQAGFDGGQAIYTAYNGSGWDHGVEIGPQAVMEPAFANAISNVGTIVGKAGDGQEHFGEAVIFTRDPRDPVVWLGKLAGFDESEAYDVNDFDLIVGTSLRFDFDGGEQRAVAWLDGQIFDLNDFLTEGSGWTQLIQATAVNNHGDIVGWGLRDDGSVRGFVMHNFVPAPGTGALLTGGGLLGIRRRR